MNPSGNSIDLNLSASEIVKRNYRTALVFNKYGIDYSFAQNSPLALVLENNSLNAEQVMDELRQISRDVRVSPQLPFREWSTDFLSDYIIHVHHEYLRLFLPQIKGELDRFVEGNEQKFPYLRELKDIFDVLSKGLIPHLKEEEEIIFPYIRQIGHAYENRDSYASLLVRTLRKPVEAMMHHEHSSMNMTLNRMRKLTQFYDAPDSASTSHKVVFALLKELDSDIVQHLFLENEILFPRAIAMENELLQIA